MTSLKYKSKYKDGSLYSHGPRLWYKYWSRVKMKVKKEHIDCCQCYWCLKERYKTNMNCPQCKKRELQSMGYHRTISLIHHESGTIVYCKCGYKKDLDEEMNKELREISDRWEADRLD